MKGLSERRYAAHAGLSRGAVQKAKASGRLVLHPDGSIDTEASDARRAATTDPAKSHRAKRPETQEPERGEAAASVRETLREQGLNAGGRTLSFTEARTAHEIAKAHLARLRLQERRGEVVDRSRALALVFRLAREERDAWLTWPARCASLMAAELSADPHQLQSLLEQYVRDHLEQLSDLRLDLR